VRGTLRESDLAESPPHPDPLPASGAREKKRDAHFLTLLASILIEVSSSLVENALSTANGFSMPR
jgi:hypothetical protein